MRTSTGTSVGHQALRLRRQALGETKGHYETYQAGADMIRGRHEAAADAYVEANIYGTPQQIIEKYAYRHEMIGDFLPNAAFSFGGLPLAEAEKSLKLFGEKVIPEVHKMTDKCRRGLIARHERPEIIRVPAVGTRSSTGDTVETPPDTKKAT